MTTDIADRMRADLDAAHVAADLRAAKRATESVANRARFPGLGELVDALREAGIEARVTFAANEATGERIGRPAPDHNTNGSIWF